MDRRATLTLIGGVLLAVLLVAITTAGEVPLAERGPSIDWEPGPLDGPELVEPSDAEFVRPGEDAGADDQELPAAVRTLFRILLYLAIAAMAVALARYAWLRRPKLTGRQNRSDEFDVLDDIAASIAADAAEQRAALERGAPRNAIVECWLRLERLIVDNGVERDPADTSTELTARVLGEFDTDTAAIQELSALYREARFSSHPLDETARARAIEALDGVHAGLRRRVRQVEEPTP